MDIPKREQIEASKHNEFAENLMKSSHSLVMQNNDWEKISRPCPRGDAHVYALQLLGNIDGKRVLDFGCGSGEISVILAKMGARVSAFDISGKLVEIAKRRSIVNHVADRVSVQVMSAHDLGYPDESFDLVFGTVILHHLNIERAVKEAARVLKKDGKAVFREPLGNSKLLWGIRRLIPIGRTAVTDIQRQLTHDDIEMISRYFSSCVCREFGLFSRLDKIVTSHGLNNMVNRLDEALLFNLPSLRKYARIVVIEVTR